MISLGKLSRALLFAGLAASSSFAFAEEAAAPAAEPVAAEAAAAPAEAAPAAEAAAAPAEAAAAEAAPAEPAVAPKPPTFNNGDVAWMLVSTALVLLMSLPGLALFYGGLVRSKNMLSTMTQTFGIFCLIGVLWVVYGYSIAFSGSEPFFGTLDKMLLKGVVYDANGFFTATATFSKGVVIPELLFAVFQMTFACITVALIAGSYAERMKFSAVLIFSVVWFTLSYLPMAHMVWWWAGPDAYDSLDKVDALNATAGYLWQLGALDFAGGTVVHINAGVAGLVAAIILGKRKGYGKTAMAPHSLTMSMIGASLLWFGWFGFNAGSNLEANGYRRAGVREHRLRHRCCRCHLVLRGVDLQGQAVAARHHLGRGGRSGRHHPGLRLRGPHGCHRDRPGVWLRLPVGRQWPQAHAGCRRLA
jgi:ammonium transporter, Amt family